MDFLLILEDNIFVLLHVGSVSIGCSLDFHKWYAGHQNNDVVMYQYSFH